MRAHLAPFLVGAHFDVLQRSNVAKILIHGHHRHFRVHGQHVFDRHRALDVAARAARAVQLAKVFGVEPVDDDRAAAIVLDHLVVRVARAAANDVGRARGAGVALDGERVLAHVVPPHVLDGAVLPLAVHALHLVGADDHVLERRALHQNEHGVLVAAFFLAFARTVAALVHFHLAIERLAGRDHLGRVVLDRVGQRVRGPLASRHAAARCVG